MKIADALQNVDRLFLDTAPVIYYGERNPQYLAVITALFRWLDKASITAVTSPVTLAECLVGPYKVASKQLQRRFYYLVANRPGTDFVHTDAPTARQAAELRARYNLDLPDALQFATALAAQCDAFLTNDKRLRRVTDVPVLLVDDLTL